MAVQPGAPARRTGGRHRGSRRRVHPEVTGHVSYGSINHRCYRGVRGGGICVAGRAPGSASLRGARRHTRRGHRRDRRRRPGVNVRARTANAPARSPAAEIGRRLRDGCRHHRARRHEQRPPCDLGRRAASGPDRAISAGAGAAIDAPRASRRQYDGHRTRSQPR